MIGPRDDTLAENEAAATYWPGMIDLVTSALMVFLLIGFVRTILDSEDLETRMVRAQQARFIELFWHEFEAELASGAIAIEPRLGYLQITFSDRVLFASGEHALEPAARGLLDRCGRLFARAAESGYRQIQVEGHTDSVPVSRGSPLRDNWELSAERALAVVRYLIGTGALPAHVFSANGYADQRPVGDNRSAEGRSKNRRIEIRLFFAQPGTRTGGADAL